MGKNGMGKNGMGKNGKVRILVGMCAALLALLWMPQMRVRAQEPVRMQDIPGPQEPARPQDGLGPAAQPAPEAMPDGLYLAAWQNVADTFAAQSAAFWQAKEAFLTAAGRPRAAAFAAEKKAEAAAGAAAWQEALNRLAAVQSAGEEARLAARQEVERTAALAAAQFAESSAQLLALEEGEGGPDGSGQPGDAAGTGPEETASKPDGSARPVEAPVQNPAVPGSLAGKKVSILGDSITTFRGYIPEGYTCYYPQEGNDLTDVNDTWWMKVINRTGMQLLVNGSYSGSAVCGDSRAEGSSAGCSNRRLVDLMGADGTVPDVILVYLGANDFFHPMNLGSWPGQATHRTDHYILDFTEAYELMLQKLQAVYPGTKIYCMTLIEANSEDHPRVNANGNTVADYNRRIKEIAAAHGISVIDVHECGIPVYELNRYTGDGTHPNREGAERMAAYVTAAILSGN